MCGIAGVSRITDVTRRMIPFLVWDIETRGIDSWGATNGADTIRNLDAIHKTFYDSMPIWSQWPWGIFHTRAASTGAITLENQHPFEVLSLDGTRRLIGIHNGIVDNHDELNLKYNRDFKCDSPHIFHALAGYSPTEEITGYGNLAWYEITADTPTPMLHLLKFNGDNLHVFELVTGEVVFCSYELSVRRAALMAGSDVKIKYEVKGDTLYTVHPRPDAPLRDAMYEGPHVRFGGRYGRRGGTSYTFDDTTDWNNNWEGWEFVNGRWESPRNRGRGRGQSRSGIVSYPALDRPHNLHTLGLQDRVDNICLVPNCHKKVSNRKTEIVCPDCLKGLDTPKLRTMTITNQHGQKTVVM